MDDDEFQSAANKLPPEKSEDRAENRDTDEDATYQFHDWALI